MTFSRQMNCTLAALLICVFSGVASDVSAQAITGTWRGKVGNTKTELKLVRRGDSLTGTSYYYEGPNNFKRYSVKGYFDDRAMQVIWWDEALLDEHGRGRFLGTGPLAPELSVAEFNCPDDGPLKLDGEISLRDQQEKKKKELHLVKTSQAPVFTDEWNFVLDNYAYGANQPYILDSIEQIAFGPKQAPDSRMEEPPIPALARIDPSFKRGPGRIAVDAASPAYTGDPVLQPAPADPAPGVTAAPAEPAKPAEQTPVVSESEPETPARTTVAGSRTVPPRPELRPDAPPSFAKAQPLIPYAANTDEKFTGRKKVLQTVIPVNGDSVEFRFYDNAEIDGDSIAIFLNGRKLREHIRLSDQAYMFRLPVDQLQDDNELVMVAENLGSIPPNTSLMVAQVGDKQFEAHLQSTEGSSALVRLVKSDALPSGKPTDPRR